MTAHPLVATVMAGVANAEDHARARADADAVDRLVTEALALDGTVDAAVFTLLVVAIETRVQPWRSTFPAEPLVGWHEAIRGRLHRHALAVFGPRGGLLAPPPVERLTPPVQRGAPSLFGL